MDIGWREIDLNELLGIDKRHLGQGESIEAIALGRTSQISPQGCHFLHLCLDQSAVSMRRF
jgi:hypothetical protein